MTAPKLSDALTKMYEDHYGPYQQKHGPAATLLTVIDAAEDLEQRVGALEMRCESQWQRIKVLEAFVHPMWPEPKPSARDGSFGEIDGTETRAPESWKAREGQIETSAFTGVPAVERRPDAREWWRCGYCAVTFDADMVDIERTHFGRRGEVCVNRGAFGWSRVLEIERVKP